LDHSKYLDSIRTIQYVLKKFVYTRNKPNSVSQFLEVHSFTLVQGMFGSNVDGVAWLVLANIRFRSPEARIACLGGHELK